MKALPMLDQVMLWVARVYAILVFIFCNLETLHELGTARMETDSQFFPSQIAWLVFTLLVLLCVWNLWSEMARLFLAIISPFAGGLVMYFLSFSRVLGGWQHDLTDVPEIILLIIAIVGSASLFWVSCRPKRTTSGSQAEVLTAVELGRS